MANAYLRWLIPGLVSVLGGAGLAVALTEAPLATDLESRATAALGDQYSWANLSVDGRDVILSGVATTQQMIDEATTKIAAVRGVRAVSTTTILAEFVSPFPFSASLSDGALTLEGGYPDEQSHSALVAAAGTATDRTRLLSGGPAADTFAAGAKFGLDALKQFDQGKASLADTSLTISGRAKSPEALQTLATFRSKVPAGIQLAALDITPPLAAPYIWTAGFDGKTVTLSGNTPTTELANALLAVIPADVATRTNLQLASGEPSGFADNALALLKSLLLLEGGEAKITDGVVTLSGAPATAAIADQVIASAASFGGTVSLAPPRIANYVLAVDKSGGRMQFSGFVPDDQTRQRLAELPGADVSALALGRGAPDRFDDGLNFGLAALDHLSQGRLDIAAEKLRLVGSAGTVADFKAATDIVAAGAPNGMSLVRAELHPPVAAPYVWSAIRAADGTTKLSGFVPDETVRTALHAKIKTLAGDSADPGEGAPEGFAASAEKGLEILNLLDTGTLKFDGAAWSIDGTVPDTTRGFVADAAYAAAGLRAAGWTYAIQLPKAPAPAALPIIAPYVWRAQKTVDGTVSFTGFAPATAFQSVSRNRVPGVLDNTVLGAGAPADFGTSALAGIDALTQLDEGSLALSGNRWTLSGEVADLATRQAVQTALFSQIDAANWQVAIQARDAAPVVTPYLWSATKGADGALELGGYLPDAGLQAEAAKLAATVTRDTSSIASGEPPGFAADLRAGLEALTHLREGKAMFDGSRWTLTGRADTQADGAAAAAALAAGSKAGALWTVAVNGYVTPPASSSSSSSSAELVASSEPSSELSSQSSAEPSSSASVAIEASSSSAAPLSSSSMVSSEVSSSEVSSSESSSSATSSSDSSSSAEASVASSEVMSSSEPVASSSSEMAAAMPQSSSSASAPVSSESSAQSSSSSLEPSSVSSSEAAPVPSSSALEVSSSSSAEPVTPTSLQVTAPMPANLVFEAVRANNSPIALKGRVPAQPAAVYFGVIAGRVPTDALVVGPGLPENFITNAIAGIEALTQLNEGRLGFDGTQWYLRGKAEGPAIKDAVTAAIDAVPMRGAWDVGITTLAPLDICRLRVGELEARNVILFQSGSAKLTPGSAAPLDELAKDLEVCPVTDVHVEGHTDADGPDDVNLILSVSRAEAVVVALVERGIAEDRLYAEGYGESEPVASNDTKDGKQQNRRIAFTIAPR